MQIKELSSLGLKRDYDVTVPASRIDELVKSKLEAIGKRIKVPGFRPGKVPLPYLEQRYKGSALQEVLEDCVTKATKEVVTKFDLNPALKPTITIKTYDPGQDFIILIAVEVLPTIGEINLEGLTFDNYVVTIPEEKITEALTVLTNPFRESHPLKEGRKLKEGDLAIIDFEGSVGKEPIEGGTGKDYRLEIGSNSFIPGFEDQLIGAEKEGMVEVKVTFPQDYQDERYAGREAHFTVRIKDIHEFEPLVLDEEFAKKLKFDSIQDLRDATKESLAQNHTSRSSLNTKRCVLDALADRFAFESPQGLVDLEFNNIWGQLIQELGTKPEEPNFSDVLKTATGREEEELRSNYREVAERRVRLGLLLSEIGQRHEITVSKDALTEELLTRARAYPDQAQAVFDYYRTNENALASVRASLFERKVIDFILAQSKVKDVPLSIEDFEKTLAREEDEAEEKIFSKKK